MKGLPAIAMGCSQTNPFDSCLPTAELITA